MPTYEYVCKNCGYRFEELQSITAEPIKTCPQCEKDTVERLVSGGAGLIFKGSGFYITDYAKKNSTGNGNGGAAHPESSSTSADKSSSETTNTKDKSKSKAES